MQYIDNILFLLIVIVGFGLFFKSLKEIYRNINLGEKIDRTDHPALSWQTMGRVALGQSKMVKRPIAGFLHIIVYLGFIIINVELIEIIIDGLFGTHRYLADIIGVGFYSFLTATLEILAVLVLIAVIIFFIRRNFYSIQRFKMKELFGWPKEDANWILIIEGVLMIAFLMMNSSDWALQQKGALAIHGSFPFSANFIAPFLENLSVS